MSARAIVCAILVGCVRPIPEPPPRSPRIGNRAIDLERGRVGGLVLATEVTLPDGAVVAGLRRRVAHGHDGIPARVGGASWNIAAGSESVTVHVEHAWLVRRNAWRDTWHAAEPLVLDAHPVVTVPAGGTLELALRFRPVGVYTTFTAFAFRIRLRVGTASYEVDAPLDVWRIDLG